MDLSIKDDFRALIFALQEEVMQFELFIKTSIYVEYKYILYNYHNSGHFLSFGGSSSIHLKTLRLKYECIYHTYMFVTMVYRNSVFYLKLSSTLLVSPYLTGNTSPVRAH
jgi:hypothetical protein